MTGASPGLARWSLFGAMLAAAGLPIYINAPKAYVDQYGVGLAALGLVLAGLRLFDVVQDPVLGWLAEKGRAHRGVWVVVAAVVMAVSMIGLFAVVPPVPPLVWFALTLAGVFTAYSYLTIVFYAQGVAKAATLGQGGHLRLAGWREGGALAGVTVAAVTPALLGGFSVFAAGFAVLTLAAVGAMAGQWSARPPLPPGAAVPSPADTSSSAVWAAFRPALADRQARGLLTLSFVNAVPVAITSTLFLFFVESRLEAPAFAGPLLVMFFVAAGVSAPVWSNLAARYGARRALMGGMVLAIGSFFGAAFLGAGDLVAFAAICVLSGAALGADMVLLPAMFARRLGQMAQGGEAAGFGLWNFASKLSLAFAAGALLPALQSAGFAAGPGNTPEALRWLTAAYAVLPCTLKLLAIALLAASPNTEE